MPPGPRRTPASQRQTVSSSGVSEPDDNATQQFELELKWCIQQLEGALISKKMNPRQAQDATKSLSVLRSKSAPLVKKRQVMRATFGDYRAKMAEEEKKMNKAQNKVTIVASTPNASSRFVKKSCAIMPEKTDNNFRFNFQVEVEECSEKKGHEVNTNFSFHISDNSFRFNFPDTEPSS